MPVSSDLFVLPDNWKRRRHYAGEPGWEWLAIEHHLSQPCAMGHWAGQATDHGCRNVQGPLMPRMPTGYCECPCHGEPVPQRRVRRRRRSDYKGPRIVVSTRVTFEVLEAARIAAAGRGLSVSGWMGEVIEREADVSRETSALP